MTPNSAVRPPMAPSSVQADPKADLRPLPVHGHRQNQDTKAGKSLFRSPKLVLLLALLAGTIGFVWYMGPLRTMALRLLRHLPTLLATLLKPLLRPLLWLLNASCCE